MSKTGEQYSGVWWDCFITVTFARAGYEEQHENITYLPPLLSYLCLFMDGILYGRSLYIEQYCYSIATILRPYRTPTTILPNYRGRVHQRRTCMYDVQGYLDLHDYSLPPGTLFPCGTLTPQSAHPIRHPAPTQWRRNMVNPPKEPPEAHPVP